MCSRTNQATFTSLHRTPPIESQSPLGFRFKHLTFAGNRIILSHRDLDQHQITLLSLTLPHLYHHPHNLETIRSRMNHANFNFFHLPYSNRISITPRFSCSHTNVLEGRKRISYGKTSPRSLHMFHLITRLDRAQVQMLSLLCLSLASTTISLATVAHEEFASMGPTIPAPGSHEEFAPMRSVVLHP
jgi:hypothetical protein